MLWHLTLSSEGRQLLFQDAAARLGAARRVARLSAGRVILFCAVDDHLHVVLQDSRFGAGRLGGVLRKGLAREGVSLAPSHLRPVESRRHLTTLVGYVLRQPAKHGLRGSAALWEGSCLPDLLGARRLPGELLPLGAVLPRWRARQVLEPVGLSRWPRQASAEGQGLAALGRAAAGSCGVPKVGGGRSPQDSLARLVFVHLALEAGFGSAVVEEALGITPRAVRRLRGREVDLSAALTWLDLEGLVVRGSEGTSVRVGDQGRP